jgi:hypothetical protein
LFIEGRTSVILLDREWNTVFFPGVSLFQSDKGIINHYTETEQKASFPDGGWGYDFHLAEILYE